MHHLLFQCISKVAENPAVHPGQAALLKCLMEQGSTSQGALCRMLKVSAASVAVSLRRMEKQGFLTRVQNPEDLREKLLCLTPLGEKTAGDMRAAVTKVQEQALMNFTPEELEQMKSYLKRIGTNLEALVGTSADPCQHEKGVF
jgi:DNA-binding MarR family transcriptional regulator